MHFTFECADTNKTSPVRIGTSINNTNWVSITAGYEHSLAINADGQLYAWGWNNSGQLGDGANYYEATLTLMKR